MWLVRDKVDRVWISCHRIVLILCYSYDAMSTKHIRNVRDVCILASIFCITVCFVLIDRVLDLCGIFGKLSRYRYLFPLRLQGSLRSPL